MTAVRKQDSNFTGLRFALEDSIATLPAMPVFKPLAPNSYKDFGGKYKSVARNPINASRQRQKGVIVDLDAMADFQSDLTYENTQQLIEGVMFADFRTKAELLVSTVDVTAGYEPATGGAAYGAFDLVFGKGFTLAANNGLKVVTGTPATSSIEFTGMASEAGSAGTISKVGFQFASGDLAVAVVGGVTTLTSTAKDFTTLGLAVGEFVFVGDDSIGNRFANAANTGYARVAGIAAHVLTLDKTDMPFVTDAGTGKTVRIYFGRVCRNEQQALIKRRTYTFERQLPSSDTATTTQQAEYVTGAAIDSFMLTLNTADKATWDLAAVANAYVTNDSSVGPIAGIRPPINESQAYNTSSDVRRSRMSIIGEDDALFAYLSQFSLTVKNNIKQNKAISVLGAFDQTAGMFDVSVATDAYFTTVDAVNAVRDNSDVTLDVILAHSNTGIVIDMPLVGLGDAQLKVTANEPITLPLTIDAADATRVNPGFNYTLLISYFDYLPTVAM